MCVFWTTEDTEDTEIGTPLRVILPCIQCLPWFFYCDTLRSRSEFTLRHCTIPVCNRAATDLFVWCWSLIPEGRAHDCYRGRLLAIFRYNPCRPTSPQKSQRLMTDVPAEFTKDEYRKSALANRRQQEDKDQLSRRIVGAFMSLPEYALADTVLFYVDARSEVRTQVDLALAITTDKNIVVPWCNQIGELELFRLTEMAQMEVGMYGILEPQESLRHLSEHRVDVEELDLIMVPGVAFSHQGARIGHGKGYYDRLLQNARPETPLVGLAFECQLFETVPVAEHDVWMDRIVTENAVYDGLRK